MNQWSIREVGKRKEGGGPGQFKFLAYMPPPPRPRTKSKVPEEKRRNIRRLILQFLQFFRPVTVEPFRIWVKYKTNHVCWTIPEVYGSHWPSVETLLTLDDDDTNAIPVEVTKGFRICMECWSWCVSGDNVVRPLGRWWLTLRWRGMSRITRSCTRWEGWSAESAVTGVHIRFSCRNNPSFRLNTQ